MSVSNSTQSPIVAIDGSPIVATDGTVGPDEMEEEEEEEEEEEDVDFNPFLREEASSEASSSLSSETEGPGDTIEMSVNCKDAVDSPQTGLEATSERDAVSENSNRLVISSPINQGESSVAAEVLTEQRLQMSKTSIQMEEDSICRRTRARQSLANYTLEELETFLQESEDEDNPYNVDDEGEYRKFLSAVLLGGDGGGGTGHEDAILDDDEDSDADFVIEIEEALESDGDECLDDNESRKGKRKVDARRPVTRQKKRPKEPPRTVNNNHIPVSIALPARPILPYFTNERLTCFATLGRQSPSSQSFSRCTLSQSGANPVNPFTEYQIGQLYCLIHEHVQLLIQVYSVCVLDPSRHQVAAEVHKMIGEMVNKREQALAWRRVPYPGTCFQPQNFYSSAHSSSPETTNCSSWVPQTDKPVQSILDVAPLALTESYMIDVTATVSKYRQRQLDVSDTSYCEKRPLFPLPNLASSDKLAIVTHGEMITVSETAVQPPAAGQEQHKKSLAATIVESTKNGSIALVPKDITELALRFHPLFNPTLFPPKPPVPAVANRVLFTDNEDRLLAMGIMEYNNDWTAIQRRFLPCKSQHQIFVRQKNRNSSKAPENPIKNVRRMKSSPLTSDEIAHICEGLKLFRRDWHLVWKNCVPHRDPSLLPRQWRITSGTQKSYKKSEDCKEKRRLYEAKRRQLKAAVTDSEILPGNEVGDEEIMAGTMDDEGEAYVHEAFLADTETRSSRPMSSAVRLSSIKRNVQLPTMMPNKGTDFSGKFAAVSSECREPQLQSGAMHEVATSSKPSLRDMDASNASYIRYSSSLRVSSEQPSSSSYSQAPTTHMGSWSCRVRKPKGSRVVKLAPDLPPINLPRSGRRIISQPTLRNFRDESHVSKTDENALTIYHHGLPQVPKEGNTTTKSTSHENRFPDNDPQSSMHAERLVADKRLAEENVSESDLHMHPLLFQDTEGQSSSYYLKSGTASGTYNFFPELPLHADSNFLGHQRSVDSSIRRTQGQEKPPLNLVTLDFHPLLHKADNPSVPSICRPSGDSEALQDNHDKLFNPSDWISRETVVGHNELTIRTSSIYHEKDKLDLEISLYSAPEKEKSAGGILLNSSVDENIHTLQLRVVEEVLHANHKDKYPENLVATNSSIRSKSPHKSTFSFEVAIPSNAGAWQYTKDPNAMSVPEIVMEQEELSDSEEEFQHVEFEREEMDDSEGEGFNNEQLSGIHTQDLLNSAAKGSGIRHIQDLNQMPQSSYLSPESNEGKNCTSPTGVVSQGPCHAKLSRLKPKSEGAKRGRACKSSVNVIGSRSKKPRKNTPQK